MMMIFPPDKSKIKKGEPPQNTPILFLSAEFGCIPLWYAGRCWQAAGQQPSYWVYPHTQDHMLRGYPMLQAPHYLGYWYTLEDDFDFVEWLDPEWYKNNMKKKLQPGLF